MELTFLGAVGTVTGSKFLLSINKRNILIDCGLFQGIKALRQRNWEPLPIPAKDIEAIILTHAHIDHSGYLPLLVKQGFQGKIHCSQGTYDLCQILLPDCGYLQEEEARHANKHGYSKHAPALPLYTRADALDTFAFFVAHPVKKEIALSQDIHFQLLPAGHIIGATTVEIRAEGKKIVFSGDLGRLQDPVMKAPTFIREADYVIMESTYGDRQHDTQDPKHQLKDIIRKTVRRGGTLVIPAFAVGRAQVVLHYISELKKERAIPEVPVYLDSPMAVDATHIFLKHREQTILSEQACRELNRATTYINLREDSKGLDTDLETPKIIISASGMATGGRILHHIKTYASDSKNTLLFTGYQSIGTRGAEITSGASQIKIHGQLVPIQAEVIALHNLSAHADAEELLKWAQHFQHPPKTVFLTHGEQDSREAFGKILKERLGWRYHIPQYQETISL